MKPIIASIAALVVSLSTFAAAQAPRRAGMSPAEQQEVLDFKLTLPLANSLLAALPEMTRYVMGRPDWTAYVQKSMQQNRDEQVRTLEADPKAAAIIRKHGLSARQYVVGVIAVRGAVLKAQNPDSPVAKNIPVSAENLALAKANLGALGPKLAEADSAAGQMFKR